MKNSVITIVLVACCYAASAQEIEISSEELYEQRKNPDTSSTVYVTEADRTGEPEVSQKEFEGSFSPNVSAGTQKSRTDGASSTGTTSTPTEKANQINGGVLTDLKFTPRSRSSASSQQSNSNSKYSATFLDTHALALAANCAPLAASGEKSTAVIPLGDSLFVIPTKSADLPPYPATGGVMGIHGVDSNQNCVRDDIEHYVFNKYPKAEQERLRLNLYAHAIWLNFFLIESISDKTAQGINRQNIKTGKCMEVLLGQEPGRLARGDLFAHLHNTMDRTERYFENLEILRGYLIEEDISGACL